MSYRRLRKKYIHRFGTSVFITLRDKSGKVMRRASKRATAHFIPSTEQLYAIYGVGIVIDYTKGSKEVQKQPDNPVKALNIWLENVNKEE